MKGQVLWWNDAKGYGFVKSGEIDEDVFLHYSGLKPRGFRVPREGDLVEFDVSRGLKGLQAVNVSVIGDSQDETPQSEHRAPVRPAPRTGWLGRIQGLLQRVLAAVSPEREDS